MTKGFYEKPDSFVSHLSRVARGQVPGESLVFVNAQNPDVGLLGEEDVWPTGGTLRYPLPVGEQWEMASSDPADTLLGLGAQQVAITFQRVGYVRDEVIADLNGVTFTDVPGLSDGLRPAEARVVAAGASLPKGNQGTITIRDKATGDVRFTITPLGNVSVNSHRTVPAGKVAQVIFAYSSTPKNRDAETEFLITDGDNGIFLRTIPAKIFQTTSQISLGVSQTIFEKSDVKLVGSSLNNNTPIQVYYQLHTFDL